MLKLILVLFLTSKFCNGNRTVEGRFFRSPITTTVVEIQTISSLVPSSCIKVQSTLVNCKSSLSLDFPQLVTNDRVAIEGTVIGWRTESKIKTTPLSWWEYFGFYAPTVTATRTDLKIVTVQDPSLMVTYSISGCKPVNLRSGINRCPPEDTVPIEDILATVTIPMPLMTIDTILPTTTVENAQPNTQLYGGKPADFHDNSLLETSTEEYADNVHFKPTEPL